MWWLELLISLTAAALGYGLLISALHFAPPTKPISLSTGANLLLIAVAIAIGTFTGKRFRAWSLRRDTRR
ncbi:hypothetical protein [Streptomyces microflavus]|uniref:hypothetical protein n=1 Tax=Streptomyces microflavus TaxID=1919 RepID=UPI00340F39CB